MCTLPTALQTLRVGAAVDQGEQWWYEVIIGVKRLMDSEGDLSATASLPRVLPERLPSLCIPNWASRSSRSIIIL